MWKFAAVGGAASTKTSVNNAAGFGWPRRWYPVGRNATVLNSRGAPCDSHGADNTTNRVNSRFRNGVDFPKKNIIGCRKRI